MDEAVIARMKEVESAVKKLDPSIRAAAFAMMRDYIMDGAASGSTSGGSAKAGGSKAKADAAKGKVVAPTDFSAFVDMFESDVPADTAMALTGWLYAQYGIERFAVQEVKDLAESAGVTIPARPDNTIRQKSWNKKKAFRRMSRGFFRPTVDGEAFLKETFGVKKGTKKRPKAEA